MTLNIILAYYGLDMLLLYASQITITNTNFIIKDKFYYF